MVDEQNTSLNLTRSPQQTNKEYSLVAVANICAGWRLRSSIEVKWLSAIGNLQQARRLAVLCSAVATLTCQRKCEARRSQIVHSSSRYTCSHSLRCLRLHDFTTEGLNFHFQFPIEPLLFIGNDFGALKIISAQAKKQKTQQQKLHHHRKTQNLIKGSTHNASP